MTTSPNTLQPYERWHIAARVFNFLWILALIASIGIWFLVSADPNLSIVTNVLEKLKFVAPGLLIVTVFIGASRACTARSVALIHDPREHEMRESVVVYLPDRSEADAASLEQALSDICDSSGLGFCGSTEQEGTEAAIYCYGPAAQPLYDAIKPLLLQHRDSTHAHIVLATGYRATRQYKTIPVHASTEASEQVPALRSAS